MTHHSVIITEGAQSIGTGFYLTLSSAGTEVMNVGLNRDQAKQTAAALPKETVNDFRGIPGAVTSPDDLDVRGGGGGVRRFGKARL